MFRPRGYPRRVQPAERRGDCAEDCCELEDNGRPDRKQPQDDLRLNNNGSFLMFRPWGYPRRVQPAEQNGYCAEDCCEWEDNGRPRRIQHQELTSAASIREYMTERKSNSYKHLFNTFPCSFPWITGDPPHGTIKPLLQYELNFTYDR